MLYSLLAATMGLAGIGSYVLALWLDRPRGIDVGKLGRFDFPSGWYLYVGSARGPGGLGSRLARHRRRLCDGKRAWWHIDHLREHALWGACWAKATAEPLECTWAARLGDVAGAQAPAAGFGASDCHCRSHLVWVPEPPTDAWSAQVLGAQRISMGGGELAEWIEILTTAEDETRENAALALARCGASAVAPLTALLASPDARARWWAARALSELGGEPCITALVSALNDADPDVRACAALALGHTGAASATRPLAARLADESAFVAGIAADALSMLGASAVPALAETLQDHRAHVRLLAVRALARIHSPRAVEALFGMLEDSSYLIRLIASDVLADQMVYFQP